MKVKKTKKSVKQRGQTNHGHGARKKWKGKGHRGGIGMSGTGKRADHKKTLVLKKYGNKYFGKKGITSKGTAKDKLNKINVGDISKNYESFMEKLGKDGYLDLSCHKVLGKGEINKKIVVKVKEISKSARKKIEEKGGNVEVIVNVKETNEESDKRGEEESDVVDEKSEEAIS